MLRMLEPELMEDAAQIIAYANADFDKPHSDFIERLKAIVNMPDFSGKALDLGCGPGDISKRFATAYPLCSIDAVDGSKAMINYAIDSSIARRTQVNFIHGKLPDVVLPKSSYDLIFSNSLLHHLPDPHMLWRFIKDHTRSGSYIAVMDLLRPDTTEMAKTLVETHAANEPEILRHDFYCSLLAAFTLEEIHQQIIVTGLSLNIEQISDRHVFISGTLS
ncbi:MAG: class I SAM-dependent methyltransferase [Methylococcales bacterium]